MASDVSEVVTATRVLDELAALVDANRERHDDEGTLRHGEVAIYRAAGGYAVQIRRRNGSAVECGRHASLRDALLSALFPEAARGE